MSAPPSSGASRHLLPLQGGADDGSGRPWLNGIQRLAQRAALFHQVVVHLEAEEEAVRQAIVAGEAKRGVGRDGALAQHDLVDAACPKIASLQP